MSPTRLFLCASGLLSVAIGLAYLVAPAAMAAVTQLDLASPTALIEIRGFYGGQLVGLGAFILLGAWRRAFAAPALLLLAATLGGTALGRVVGMLAAGSVPRVMLGLLAVEVAATLAALLLFARARRAP